jgi:hypothetical protein
MISIEHTPDLLSGIPQGAQMLAYQGVCKVNWLVTLEAGGLGL